MKRHIVLTIIAATVLGTLHVTAQQSASPAPATADIKIFALNLSGAGVDLRLGGDTLVFSVSALAPMSATKMTVAKTAGSWQLSYKTAGDTFTPVKNESGQPYSYALQSGKSYLIRYASETKAELFQITEPDTKSAKIAFVNAGDATVAQIQVGNAFGENTLVAMKNLPAGEHSNFGSVNFAANYGLFWSTGANSSAALSDSSGKPLTTMFAEGSYWVLVLSKDTAKGNLTGRLFNVSP